MFTGIVEGTGVVRALDRAPDGVRLTVEAPFPAGSVATGESVAVNGCCLTAVQQTEGVVAFDLLEETLRVTNLHRLGPGGLVNLERAVPAGGRMGGHFVTGHIDCTAPIVALDPVGADHRLEVALPAEFARYVVYKGSVAVDGMSLTVAEVGDAGLVIWIIPHTREVTNLAGRKAGDLVNLEFDLLAKYVERIVAR